MAFRKMPFSIFLILSLSKDAQPPCSASGPERNPRIRARVEQNNTHRSRAMRARIVRALVSLVLIVSIGSALGACRHTAAGAKQDIKTDTR